MTPESVIPFRAGREPGIVAEPMAVPAFNGPHVLLADISEFQPDVADAAYLAWSRAIIIRCLYGDAHQDHAWYGGQRRALLHAGGARFLGVYAYLVAGQSGAAQAQAFHDLVGPIRPGEVFIADFEEGAKPVLSAWYAKMLALYGQAIRPYLWTYSGLWFGESQGVLPVEWIAAYGQSEPSTPHRLWQFSSSFQVPGIGVADCSVFHGNIDQLAALAYQSSKPKPVPPPPPKPPAPHPAPKPPVIPTLEELVALAPTVKAGDSGQAVKNWQGLLCAHGHQVAIDGAFGNATKAATVAFQKQHGLTQDGVAGPLSLKAALTA